MDVDAYLERIGYTGSRAPTAETLGHLHRSHLLSVPFENLDIALGRRIVPSPERFFDKIVSARRGGFCYELNGLFAWLLEQLGYPVTLLSARVCDGAQPGPEFDHLTLVVGREQNVIADVGFGDSFLEPLTIGAIAVYQNSAYRVTGSEAERVLERRRESDWERQYIFSMVPRRLADFGGMLEYHQTSPSSHFTRKAICSMATPDGRLTLSGRRAIRTKGSRREEREVANPDEYRVLLKDWFGIDLGDDTLAETLFG
jgi:N-hydroxyarylamine O-acetyltransferase